MDTVRQKNRIVVIYHVRRPGDLVWPAWLPGYLDVGILVLKKYLWNSEGYFRTASDFPWTVPLGHAFLMLVLGVMFAVLRPAWPRLFSLRTASWLFATFGDLDGPVEDAAVWRMQPGAGGRHWVA